MRKFGIAGLLAIVLGFALTVGLSTGASAQLIFEGTPGAKCRIVERGHVAARFVMRRAPVSWGGIALVNVKYITPTLVVTCSKKGFVTQSVKAAAQFVIMTTEIEPCTTPASFSREERHAFCDKFFRERIKYDAATEYSRIIVALKPVRGK